MEPQFDITIIGGGITGMGVALEAAKRGQKICLIDRAECGLGTSNNSLRIIHGGLRYLQNFDFLRMLTSVADQKYCLKSYPDLVKPLRCVAPLSGKGLKRANLARLGCLLYSCFLGALESPLDRPYVEPRKSFEGLSFLDGLATSGFLVWQDALLLDHRALCQRLLSSIRQLGGVITEQANYRSHKDLGNSVEVLYELPDGTQAQIVSRKVVNSLGAWIGIIDGAPVTDWCIGFNLILKRQFTSDIAFGCDGEEGRYFFFVPRQDKTVVGTEYIPLHSNSERVAPTQSDIRQFIEAASKAAPLLNLSEDDIESVEFGILPMKGVSQKGRIQLYGASKIVQSKNLVHVLSTKYTSFRSQALQVLKALD